MAGGRLTGPRPESFSDHHMQDGVSVSQREAGDLAPPAVRRAEDDLAVDVADLVHLSHDHPAEPALAVGEQVALNDLAGEAGDDHDFLLRSV